MYKILLSDFMTVGFLLSLFYFFNDSIFTLDCYFYN